MVFDKTGPGLQRLVWQLRFFYLEFWASFSHYLNFSMYSAMFGPTDC